MPIPMSGKSLPFVPDEKAVTMPWNSFVDGRTVEMEKILPELKEILQEQTWRHQEQLKEMRLQLREDMKEALRGWKAAQEHTHETAENAEEKHFKFGSEIESPRSPKQRASSPPCIDTLYATTPTVTKGLAPNTGGDKSSGVPITAAHSELKDRYISVFDRLAELPENVVDDNGALPHTVLLQALTAMGEAPSRARKLMSSIDRNGDGVVDRDEWLSGVDELLDGQRQCGLDHVQSFMETIDKRSMTKQETPKVKIVVRGWTLIPFQSRLRIMWDLCMSGLLLHVAIVLPFEIGFLVSVPSDGLVYLGLAIDCVFMLDVVFNFRTTYIDSENTEVTDGRIIACNYLKTWFLLDLISSMPLEHITSGLLPSMNMTKVVRIGKVVKLVKMLRFTKATRFADRFADYIAVSGGTLLWGMLAVVCAVILLCHWLACFLPAVGDGFLVSYAYGGPAISTRYITAVYWAVTTITTVGYGDVLPTTDAERGYAICAMMIGGALYSCVIGNVFVILNNRNLNAQAMLQRLRQVLSFLDRHHLPPQVRSRVWLFHRKSLKLKSAQDGFSVLGDLPPELRSAVAFVIVPEDVRSNPLFHGLPSIVILHLASIIKNVTSEVGEVVAAVGEYGFAMSVIVEGSAVMDESGSPVKTYEAAMKLVAHPAPSQVMLPGDSFGEEILLCVTRMYTCNVVGCSNLMVTQIPAEEFMMHFQSMPDILKKMRDNFKSSHFSRVNDNLSPLK